MSTIQNDSSEEALPLDTFPERYQILHLLGSGGSGDAYLAWDSSLRRQIVIKRVRTDSSDQDAVQWILDEAGKMAALKHPNIVAVHDVALSEGAPCIVMEHVIGQNLDELMVNSGPLRLEMFVELAQQTLDALFTAHQTGMIHRDLKPSNVMITSLPSGSIQAKLLDFGLAKFINTQAPSPQTVSIDGSVHGTIQYISPEQLSREPVGIHSDLYSLGCTLYFSLTGQPPFGGSTVSEVIASHLNHSVITPSKLREDLPLELSVWLMRLIARRPHDRFANALVALQGLREAAYSSQILMMTTGSIPVSSSTVFIPAPEPIRALPQLEKTKRRWLPLTLGIAGALTLGALVGSYGLNGSDTEIRTAPAAPLAMSVPDRSSEKMPSIAAPPSTDSGSPAAIVTPSVSIPRTAPAAPLAMSVPDRSLENIPTIVAPPSTDSGSSAAIVTPPVIIPIAQLEPKIMLRVAGSNTIGAKLLPSLMERFLTKMNAKEIRREHLIKEETVISFNLDGVSDRQAILIQAHGSSTAFQSLQKETCDIGISSRPIKKEEIETLKPLGDMLSHACEHVVGLDGLAVIVCRGNPIQSLNLEQIAGIFSGKIQDWSEVGGNAGPIHLYARDDQSGTYDSFRSMVLGNQTLNADAKRYEDSAELSDAVATDISGIGFIGLPYVRNAKALAVAEVGVRALLPNSFSVATEDYVLSRRLYIYTPVMPRHPWTTAFAEFTLTDEGQKLVEDAGFISQQIGIESIKANEKMPERYREFASNSEGRLSLSFRFRPGATELDAKAVRDLDRVVKLLSKPENRSKHVNLLGFSDQSGNRSSNLKLSEERAKEISEQLAMRGVPINDVLAMGPEMPVASNSTKTGQEKNRRVEIWIGSL